MTEWTERITADPNVCHGKPCIRGTRIVVAVVLDSLAEGMTPEEIVAVYPPLTLNDIRAAMGLGTCLRR
jgi:uncharacterized protein (DUF433 family)